MWPNHTILYGQVSQFGTTVEHMGQIFQRECVIFLRQYKTQVESPDIGEISGLCHIHQIVHHVAIAIFAL
jgi:hypothetical protein